MTFPQCVTVSTVLLYCNGYWKNCRAEVTKLWEAPEKLQQHLWNYLVKQALEYWLRVWAGPLEVHLCDNVRFLPNPNLSLCLPLGTSRITFVGWIGTPKCTLDPWTV